MAPARGKRRGIRRWRFVVPLLLALPAVALAALNLLLSTPWACHRISRKIQQHAGGLETRVGGAAFTPWDGISIRRIELLQPPPLRAGAREPLLRIRSLRIAPVWRAWLRGRLEVRDIELDTPRVVLPVELIAHLAKSAPQQRPPATPPQVPPVAAVSPPTASPTVATPPSPPSAGTPPPAAVADAANPKPAPLPATPPQPTGWIHLDHASFALVHAGAGHGLLEISDTGGSIPVSGDAARAVLTLGSISLLDTPRTSGVPVTLEWKDHRLTVQPPEAEIAGCKFRIAAQLASFSGLPLQIEAQLPRQKLPTTAIPFGGQAGAEAVTVSARFAGLLLAPASWQGDAVAECLSPSFTVASHEAKFDRGRAIAVLRGGILSCPDARLIGDDLSLLGNATLLADGRLAAAARVVATPDTAVAIASRTFPAIQGAPSLTPLSTPQRAAFDLEALGTIGQLFLRLGKDGPVVELKP